MSLSQQRLYEPYLREFRNHTCQLIKSMIAPLPKSTSGDLKSNFAFNNARGFKMFLPSSASDTSGVLLVGVRHFKVLVMSLEGFENGFWTNTIPLLELACFPFLFFFSNYSGSLFRIQWLSDGMVTQKGCSAGQHTQHLEKVIDQPEIPSSVWRPAQ